MYVMYMHQIQYWHAHIFTHRHYILQLCTITSSCRPSVVKAPIYLVHVCHVLPPGAGDVCVHVMASYLV